MHEREAQDSTDRPDPSGLPDGEQEQEPTPLGGEDDRSKQRPRPGEEAMPGIPSEDEPEISG